MLRVLCKRLLPERLYLNPVSAPVPNIYANKTISLLHPLTSLFTITLIKIPKKNSKSERH